MNTVGKRFQYYFFHAYVSLHALCVNILNALVTDKYVCNRDTNHCPPLCGLQTISATQQLTTKTTIANVESIECTVRRSWIRDVKYIGVVESLYNFYAVRRANRRSMVQSCESMNERVFLISCNLVICIQ